MLRHFKAPQRPQDGEQGRIRVFLGGTIEMGASEDWQQKLVDHIAALPCADRIDLYNPRRDGWDNSLPQSRGNAQFKEQVDWELENQKSADIIVYYFTDGSVSPITLLELGLFHNRNPVIGAGPDYKRLGNLMVTKDHFPMDIHVGWDAFVRALDARITVESAVRPRPIKTAPPVP